MLHRALGIKEQYYGKNHPEVGIVLTNLGNAYVASRGAVEAINLLNRALTIFENYYQEDVKDHPEVAAVLTNLGNAHAILGHTAESIGLLKRALDIKERYYEENHQEVAIVLTNLGNAYVASREAVETINLLNRALTIFENYYKENVKDHPEVAVVLANLGNAHAILGHTVEAIELLNRALDIKERYYGKDHLEVAITLTSLSDIYANLGCVDKQKELLDQSLLISLSPELIKMGDKLFPNQQELQKLFINSIKSRIPFEQLINFIILKNGNINVAGDKGITLLMFACRMNNHNAAEKLIIAGADKNAKDVHATVLHYAFIHADSKLLTYLLEQGCSPNVTDNDGDYPELWAIEKDLLENLQVALELKKRDGSYLIDINRIQQSTGQNVLRSAEKLHSTKCLVYLEQLMKDRIGLLPAGELLFSASQTDQKKRSGNGNEDKPQKQVVTQCDLAITEVALSSNANTSLAVQPQRQEGLAPESRPQYKA